MWSRTSLLVLLALALVGCQAPDPNAPPMIGSADEFNQVLAQAESLSKEHLLAAEAGEPLSSTDQTELKRAAVLFEGLMDYRPNNVAVHVGAGQIYMALDEAERARAPLQQAVIAAGEEPSDADRYLAAEAYYHLSRVDLFAQNLDGALENAQKAVDLAFDVAKFQNALAQAYVQQRQFDKAREHLQAALLTDPENTEAKGLLEFIKSVEEPN